MLHTLRHDQSRKCCFNSKNHISSPVHKLIIKNYAAGQERAEEKGRGSRKYHRIQPQWLKCACCAVTWRKSLQQSPRYSVLTWKKWNTNLQPNEIKDSSVCWALRRSRKWLSWLSWENMYGFLFSFELHSDWLADVQLIWHIPIRCQTWSSISAVVLIVSITSGSFESV